MNYKRSAALLLFVLGIIIAAENFVMIFKISEWKLKLYYFLLTLAVLFLSAGAWYVWRKEKKEG